MMKIFKIATFTIAGLLLVGISAVYFIIAPRADNMMNPVLDHTPYPVTATAATLHKTIPVADLHADTFLWKRNPAKRQKRGHVDIPRLREGGFAFQLFTTVTKTPPGLNYEENSAEKDDITTLAIAQLWPVRTWNSIFERARYQAQRLQKLAQKDEDLYFVRNRNDLETTIQKHRQNKNVIAALMGMEGAHPLEGQLTNMDRLFDDGFRVIGLQHFFDNELGGSLHGQSNQGLTEFGRSVITKADQMEMIIDVAHSSPATVLETLTLTTRPLIVSHTGFDGHCPSKRNISDDLMRKITSKGGLIGVGFWEDVICDATPEGIARALVYGIKNFGEDHIALGSDYDGTVITRLDASEVAAITQALLDQGVEPGIIRKVMGENTIRFFLQNLPT